MQNNRWIEIYSCHELNGTETVANFDEKDWRKAMDYLRGLRKANPKISYSAEIWGHSPSTVSQLVKNLNW